MAAANSKTTAKPKGKGKPRGKPFPKGVSGNPAGRPKDNESFSGILKELLNKNPEELAEMFGNNDLGRAYKQYSPGVQMKWQLGGRMLASQMHEPTSGMINTILDRTEGKVPDKMIHEGTLNVENLESILNKVYGKDDNSDTTSG